MEPLIEGELRPVELAGQRGPHHRPGEADVDPRPFSVRTARPAGVDEPRPGLVPIEVLPEEVGVGVGKPRHERGPEEAGERGPRLGDPRLRPGELARVAHEEPQLGLVGLEAGDRGEDAVGVSGEEHHDRRVPRPPGGIGVMDEREGVAGAGVLGEPPVVEVEPAIGGDERVLHDRPVVLRRRLVHHCPVDVRLLGGIEADHLRVAAPLEVEDPLLAPPVLVVAEEGPLGIGGERRLPRPGEAEEEGGAAIGADVGRPVQGEDPQRGEEEVHHRKQELLHRPEVR